MKLQCTSGALCAAFLLTMAAHAQTYPAKPILVIIPLQAGSAGDAMLRIIMQRMSENMKQQIVIENQPGAAGLVGAQRVARMAPDGYVLGGFSDGVVNYAPSLAEKPGFDPLNDFDPVSFVCNITYGFIMHPSLPVNNVREFIALAKANPGKINYASSGSGSAQHVVTELFKAATGISLTHVPYRGATQQVMDVIAGQIPVAFTGLSIPLPYIKERRVRALAVLSEQRSPLLPDVPTMSEAGVPGFIFSTWLGIYAPKGTPKPIIARLNAEVAKALSAPDIRDRLVALAFEPQSSTPEELGKKTRDGLARVAKIIKDAGIKAD